MSTGKCEERLSNPPHIPHGYKCYICTKSGNTVNCSVSSSKYEIEVENHKPHSVGIKLELETTNGDVEFDHNGNFKKSYEESIFLKPRSTSENTDSIIVDIQAATSNTTEDIITELNFNKIKMSAIPDVDEDLQVDT